MSQNFEMTFRHSTLPSFSPETFSPTFEIWIFKEGPKINKYAEKTQTKSQI